MSDDVRGPATVRGELPVISQPHADPAWLALQQAEDIIEPDLPIIDPHHHFSDRWGGYLGADLLADIGSGHRIEATVHLQCRHGYRTSGPAALAPVGETEAVLAIVGTLPRETSTRVCAGIVGYADLTLGAEVQSVLEAHVEAAQGRFRGVRASIARDETFHYGVLPRPQANLYADERFLAGFSRLSALDLAFDTWCFHHQLDQVLDLARAFPQTRIVVNHFGGPLGVGRYRIPRAAVLGEWQAAMKRLAACGNVFVKLGGLGIAVFGLDFEASRTPPSSQELAEAWRPYVEPCIDIFGVDRCMFESNFPVDKGNCNYWVLWNAFKRLTAGASAAEKAALFHDTAKSFYRL